MGLDKIKEIEDAKQPVTGSPFTSLKARLDANDNQIGILQKNKVNWINVTEAPYLAKGDGVTNDVTAIQQAHDAIVASGKKGVLYIPSGSYRINSKLTIDVSYVSVISDGATLDARSITSGTVLYVTGSVVGAEQADMVLSGFTLVGDTTQARGIVGTVGIEFDGASYKGANHLDLLNVSVKHFETDIYYGDHAYIINLHGCKIEKATTGIHSPSGKVDAGERLSFFGCTIANCSTAVKAENPNGSLHFSSCSIDYVTVKWFDINGAQVFLSICHLEASPDDFPEGAPIKVAGNGGSFVMQGGKLLFGSAATQTPYVFEITNSLETGGGVLLNGVFTALIKTTTDFFATGTGYIKITDLLSYDQSDNPRFLSEAMNLLADGGFEKTNINDNFFLRKDGATSTDLQSRTTGTNITLSLDSTQFRNGTKSLKVSKPVGGAGTGASFALAIPIELGSRPAAKFYIKKPGTGTGTINVDCYWATMKTNQYGVPEPLAISSSLYNNQITYTSTSSDWTLKNLMNRQPDKRRPPWATHFYIGFNLDNFGADSIYLDDFLITVM